MSNENPNQPEKEDLNIKLAKMIGSFLEYSELVKLEKFLTTELEDFKSNKRGLYVIDQQTYKRTWKILLQERGVDVNNPKLKQFGVETKQFNEWRGIDTRIKSEAFTANFQLFQTTNLSLLDNFLRDPPTKITSFQERSLARLLAMAKRRKSKNLSNIYSNINHFLVKTGPKRNNKRRVKIPDSDPKMTKLFFDSKYFSLMDLYKQRFPEYLVFERIDVFSRPEALIQIIPNSFVYWKYKNTDVVYKIPIKIGRTLYHIMTHITPPIFGNEDITKYLPVEPIRESPPAPFYRTRTIPKPLIFYTRS